jgi:predicted SprT family Zn-dependent metalloprotease
MSLVGVIYIEDNETNINGLLFSKKTSNTLFAFVPHNLTQYEDIK